MVAIRGVCLALGAALAFCGSARAEPTSYPGVMCRPNSMATEPSVDLFRAVAAPGGPSTGYLVLKGHVTCPIIRDATGNTDGLAAAQVHLVAPAQNAGSAECVLTSTSQDGKLLDMETRRRTTSGVLDFGRTLDVSDALGYYNLFCRLPSGWTVTRYAIDEHGPRRDDAAGARAKSDATYYNAAEWCFPAERTAAASLGYFGYPPDGYTTNTAVTCPILSRVSPAASPLQSVRIHLKGPEVGTVRCALYLTAADGRAVQTKSASDAGGIVALDFTDFAPFAGFSAREGSYHLACSFGPDEYWAIKGYRVVESPPSDTGAQTEPLP